MHHVTLHFPLSFMLKVVAQQIKIEPNHLSGGLGSSTHFDNLQKNWISESEVSQYKMMVWNYTFSKV